MILAAEASRCRPSRRIHPQPRMDVGQGVEDAFDHRLLSGEEGVGGHDAAGGELVDDELHEADLGGGEAAVVQALQVGFGHYRNLPHLSLDFWKRAAYFIFVLPIYKMGVRKWKP